MRCKNCNSENVIIQAQEAKNTIRLPIIFIFLGLGMMFFGILGAIVGFFIGLVIGSIVKGLMPNIYETVVTCQNCGQVYVIKPGKQQKELQSYKEE